MKPTFLVKVLAGSALVIGVSARIYNLIFPGKYVFDEVFFPAMAQGLLHHNRIFDAHPPFGKWLISLGILAFGDVPLGWRIVPLLFGLALIPLFTYIAWSIFRKEPYRKEMALWTAAFVAMDCMFIVYSRYSLMEGMLVFFCMLTFLGALLAKKPWQIVLVAVSFGMAVSVKWLCLATIVPVLYIFWRRGLLWDFILDLPFSVLVYVVSVMSGEAINGSHNLWADFILWHKQVWGFETSLTATHPWGSVWWTWPLLYKPLLFFREATADGHSQIIVAIPNPCLWWSSGVAVVLSIGELVRQRFILKRPIADHLLVPLLLGWAAFWLPWAGVHRVLFIYHYLPSFGFALFMLVFWLAKLWHRMSELVVLFIALALVVTLFFIPLLMALPVPQEWVQTHVWIASWVY